MSFNIELHKEVTQVTTRQDQTLGIMRWGLDNSYPQTLKNIVEQSPSAKPAVSRTAKFYKGQGFEGEDTIVSPYGLTLKKVVAIMAEDYAMFEAFALHCNYNIKGEVVGINPMRITDLRFNEFDELNFASKIGYHENFGLNSEVQRTITNMVSRNKIRWIDRFNPDVVENQIMNLGKDDSESEIAQLTKGIGMYKGQILYHTETGHSSYPISPLQAPINYVLSDVENSILVRKETATGFISTYLLKTMLDENDANLIALEDAIERAQGARGSGKVITMSGLSEAEMAGTVLEELGGGAGGRSAIIESAKLAFELDQKVIHGAYLIPPILAGADVATGFSTEALKDAYFVFNSITQGGRDTIESELNRILAISTFKVKEIQIEKLELDLEEEGDEVEVDENGLPIANPKEDPKADQKKIEKSETKVEKTEPKTKE